MLERRILLNAVTASRALLGSSSINALMLFIALKIKCGLIWDLMVLSSRDFTKASNFRLSSWFFLDYCHIMVNKIDTIPNEKEDEGREKRCC